MADKPQHAAESETARAQIRAEVDRAPPLSVRQREVLRRIFTAAREARERAAAERADTGAKPDTH